MAQLTLAEALALSQDARVVTTATAPYTLVHVNKAWSKITGYRFTEVVGTSCAFLQGPATASKVLETLNAAIRSRKPIKTKLVNYTRDGAPFLCHIDCGPVKGGTHFCATIKASPIDESEDVEGRAPAPPLAPPVPVSWAERQAGTRPKRVRDPHAYRLSDAVNNQTQPLVLCSPDYPHQIIHPNQPWLEMCGYTAEEVEGLTNKVLTGPETDKAQLAELLACVRKREPATVSVINYKASGHRFLNQLKCVPVYDEKDELAAFMSMLHEIEDLGPDPLWAPLAHTHERTANDQASTRGLGAAAAHSHAARYEAAGRLIRNHVRVLADLTNVAGPPPSQPGLTRLDPAVASSAEADLMLREVARRLLGYRGSEEPVVCEPLLPGSPWAPGAASYLKGRLGDCSTPTAKCTTSDGATFERERDMSLPAGLAFCAVLDELAGAGA